MTATLQERPPVLTGQKPPRKIAPKGSLMKFRLLANNDGRAVGPHVDFARDPDGHILCDEPKWDHETKTMVEAPLERQYYPGDVVLSEVDLCAAEANMNSGGQGNWKKKFERVHEGDGVGQAPAVMTVEEARRFLESQGAKIEMPASKTSEVAVSPVKSGNRVTLESLAAMEYKALVDLAKSEKVDLKGKSKKEEVVQVIYAALNAS